MNLSIVKDAITFMSDHDISAVAKVGPEVQSLLMDLEFIKESEGVLSFADHAEQNANLLNVLTYVSNFFPLFSVQSPALFAFGAEIELKNNVWANQKGKVSSTTGSGMKPGKAMKSCLGEVAERLAQYQDNGLAVAHIAGDHRRVLDFNSEDRCTSNRFLSAHCLHTNEQVLVPENDCVYGTRHGGSPIPTNVGCGAGVSLTNATLHGLYELVERDAVSLWWRGGRFGRPIELSSETNQGMSKLLARLGGKTRDRRSWLLDITTDIGIPCVAAISSDSNGKRICVGSAAGPSLMIAATKAVVEMCTMELAYQLIERKRSQNKQADLNPTEEKQLQRAELLSAGECALFMPKNAPRNHGEAVSTNDKSDELRQMLDRIAAVDLDMYFVDLSFKELGVPVGRCLSTKLETFPDFQARKRLLRCIERHGGGDAHHGGVAIF